MTTATICATREVSWSLSFYRAEQYDSDLGLYYLRARYYNPATGRFLSRDPEDGKAIDPETLRKYLYAGGDPVNLIDPSGRADAEEEEGAYIDLGATNPVTILVLKGAVCTALDVLIEKLLGEPFGWPVGTGAGFLVCAFWV